MYLSLSLYIYIYIHMHVNRCISFSTMYCMYLCVYFFDKCNINVLNGSMRLDTTFELSTPHTKNCQTKNL